MAWIASLLAPYLFRIIIGAAIVAAVGGLWVANNIHEFNKGYAKALHDIAAKDERAVHAADDAKKEVSDCVSNGGVWSTTDGVCSR